MPTESKSKTTHLEAVQRWSAVREREPVQTIEEDSDGLLVLLPEARAAALLDVEAAERVARADERRKVLEEVVKILRDQVEVNGRARNGGNMTAIGREDCITRANALGSMANHIAAIAAQPGEG